MSKTLVIATFNQGKVKEIKEMLKELDLEIKTLEDFPEIETCEETGSTFFENALQKARYYAEKTGFMCLADDSGLEVDALGGLPGVHSARFAGENATDEENNQKLLKLLEGVPPEKRKARFVCVMIVYHPEGKYIKAEGVWKGRIATEPRGTYGFGYDPLFLIPEYNFEKTSAEIPIEEKNKLSHRAKALKNLKKILPEFLKSLNK
jgi:XTP/dITP diphosphohydrolase